MSRWFVAVLIVGALALTGCASLPSGPTVMVLPGTGKTFELFQADVATCRQWAADQSGVSTSSAGRPGLTGAAIGTAVGAAAGAALGAAAGNPALGAAAGAGAGLLGGTAYGASSASATYSSTQRSYDNAYMQCMYAKGNQIPLHGSPRNISSAAPPPPPPASAPPTPSGPPPPPPPAGTPPPPPPGVR
jgi:hypothetical protein